MRLLALAAVGLALAAPASAATISAKLKTATRTPTVGEPWRYTVTVRRDGKPVVARLRLEVLLGGTVVGCWKRRELAQCLDGPLSDSLRFRGRRAAVIRWPAESVGARLTFQALVTTGGKTLRLRAPVRVQPAG